MLLWISSLDPEGKGHNIVGSSYAWVTLEFLSLRVVHIEPPAIPQ